MVEVYHLSQLSLLFGKLRILLLLLSQFTCSLKESLEVLLVALILEKIDLGEQLIFLLL